MKCNEFAIDLKNVRYGLATKIKMGKSLYFGDIECSYLCGAMHSLEKIINNNQEKPYETVDEVIGDLQIILTKNWNYYKRKYDYRAYSKLNVEQLIGVKFSEVR